MQGCPVVHLANVHHRVNDGHVVPVVKNVLTDESHECKREARITSRKPNRPRRQLAVTTAPINAPMIPSNATSLPVRYKFRITVRGSSHAFPYLSGVPG